MSSILQSLGKMTQTQQANLKASNLSLEAANNQAAAISLESELLELHDQVEHDLAELRDVQADLATQTDDVLHANLTGGTLTDLVDQTIDAYGEKGMDEQAAELMAISVECVLKAAKIDCSLEEIVPSFESNMSYAQYSTEAEEKKDGMVKRFFTWLMEAFKTMLTTVKSFVNKFRLNCTSVETYIGKVKQKVDKFEGTSGKEVSAGSAAVYLTSGNGQWAEPEKVIREIMTDYQDFTSKWHGTFGGLNKIDPIKGMSQVDDRWTSQVSQAIGDIYRGGTPWLKGVKFIPTHAITVDLGKDAGARMIGSRVSVEMTGSAPNGKAPALHAPQMKGGLTSATAALAALKKIQPEIDKWVKNAETINKVGNRTIATGMFVQGNNKAAQNDTINNALNVWRSLVACNNVMVAGWTKTMYLVLTAIKANVRYIELSAGGTGTADMNVIDNTGAQHGQLAIGNS